VCSVPERLECEVLQLRRYINPLPLLFLPTRQAIQVRCGPMWSYAVISRTGTSKVRNLVLCDVSTEDASMTAWSHKSQVCPRWTVYQAENRRGGVDR